MAKFIPVLLLCFAYSHSAVIRTFVVQRVEDPLLSQEEKKSVEDELINDLNRQTLALNKRGLERAVSSSSDVDTKNKRVIPPWIRGRYGRSAVLMNTQHGSLKAKQREIRAKLKQILLKRSLENGMSTADKNRYARTLWRLQRYAGDDNKVALRSIIGERISGTAGIEKIKSRELNALRASLHKRIRAAPGWHHGRYGRRVLSEDQAQAKRGLPAWVKGRYGKEAEKDYDVNEEANDEELTERNEEEMQEDELVTEDETEENEEEEKRSFDDDASS